MVMVSLKAAYTSLSCISILSPLETFRESCADQTSGGCNSRPYFELETSSCLITGSAPFANGSTFIQGKLQQKSWEQSCDLSGRTLASQSYRI